MKTFHIYALCEPGTGEVRYIGATHNPVQRMYNHWRLSNSNNHNGWKSPSVLWLEALKQLKTKPTMQILEVVPEDQWREAERKWIAFYREQGANLTNISPGGDSVSEETLQKRRGNPNKRSVSEQARKKQSESMKKRYQDPEVRRAVSETTRKQWANPEMRATLVEALNRPEVRERFHESASKAWVKRAQRSKEKAS